MLRNLFGGSSNNTQVANIGVKELRQRMDRHESMLLLDVRTAEEFAHDGHISGSRLIPLHALALRTDELPKDTTIVCVCRSGNRSRTACELLARKGFRDVINLQGGMIAWRMAGQPVA